MLLTLSLLTAAGLAALIATPAFADQTTANRVAAADFSRAWRRVTFGPAEHGSTGAFTATIVLPVSVSSALQGAPPQKAFVYSDAYMLRRRIHKYASLATAPLFVAQYLVGKQLYDGDTSDGVRNAHSMLAAGVGLLFGINTATGAMNLWEGRKDPNGRTKRVIHAALMLAADVGFLATAGTAPGSNEDGTRAADDKRRTHRNVAIVSFSSASLGYVMMLFYKST